MGSTVGIWPPSGTMATRLVRRAKRSERLLASRSPTNTSLPKVKGEFRCVGGERRRGVQRPTWHAVGGESNGRRAVKAESAQVLECVAAAVDDGRASRGLRGGGHG